MSAGAVGEVRKAMGIDSSFYLQLELRRRRPTSSTIEPSRGCERSRSEPPIGRCSHGETGSGIGSLCEVGEGRSDLRCDKIEVVALAVEHYRDFGKQRPPSPVAARARVRRIRWCWPSASDVGSLSRLRAAPNFHSAPCSVCHAACRVVCRGCHHHLCTMCVRVVRRCRPADA